MEGWVGELELYVQALFNAYFHFNRNIYLWLCAQVLYNELFFFRDSIVVPVYNNVDVVSKSYYNAIIGLELLFHPIEREVVSHIIGESTRRLKVSDKL